MPPQNETLPFVAFFGSIVCGTALLLWTSVAWVYMALLWVPMVLGLRLATHRFAAWSNCKALQKRTNLRGRVAIVTGANAGIGFYTALQLMEMGATVVITCRTVDKTKETARRLREEYWKRQNGSRTVARNGASQKEQAIPDVRDTFALETDDFSSIHAFVKSFKDSGLPLHYLVNNAGMITKPLTFSRFDSSLELHTAVNFLGPHLLAELLFPLLVETAKDGGDARLVVVASSGHKNFELSDKTKIGKLLGQGLIVDALDKLNQGESNASGPLAKANSFQHSAFRYAFSKCCNVYTAHFFASLSAQRCGGGVSVCSLHPGLVATSFGHNISSLFKTLDWLFYAFLKTSEEGSQTTVYACICPRREHASISVPKYKETSNDFITHLAPYFVECREQTKRELMPVGWSQKDAEEVTQWAQKRLRVATNKPLPLATSA